MDRGIGGVSIDDFKLCLFLYADDSIIISSNKEELQYSLDILHDYCQKLHLYVNVQKRKLLFLERVDACQCMISGFMVIFTLLELIPIMF